MDGKPDDGGADDGAYRIEQRMRSCTKLDGNEDICVLIANSRRCSVGIPTEAHDHTVSGHSPLR